MRVIPEEDYQTILNAAKSWFASRKRKRTSDPDTFIYRGCYESFLCRLCI